MCKPSCSSQEIQDPLQYGVNCAVDLFVAYSLLPECKLENIAEELPGNTCRWKACHDNLWESTDCKPECSSVAQLAMKNGQTDVECGFHAYGEKMEHSNISEVVKLSIFGALAAGLVLSIFYHSC